LWRGVRGSLLLQGQRNAQHTTFDLVDGSGIVYVHAFDSEEKTDLGV